MKRQDLWFCVLLLLAGVVIRAHAIEALPPFNDESLHVRRAEKVLVEREWTLTPFKLLVYYLVAFFRPDRVDAIFLGRTGVALFSLIGLSGTYATAKLLFDEWAARVALILATFSPFMIFFDRLILADPVTAALGILLVWMSVRAVRRQSCGRGCPEAIGAGVLGTLVILAKSIGAPFLAMPGVAVLTFGKGDPLKSLRVKTLWKWCFERVRAYQAMLWTTYIAFGLSMAPFVLHVIERAITGNYVMIVNNNLVLGLAEDRPPHEIIVKNFETLWNVNWILHSPPLWLLILVATAVLMWRRPREAFFLICAVILPWAMSIFLGAELSTRYLTLGILPLYVILAGGLKAIGEGVPGRGINFKPVLTALVGLWIVLFSLPFIDNAWNDPTELNLPSRDKWEYFTNFSSGYGLVDAVDDFEEKLTVSVPSGRINVIGLVGSCHQIRLYLPDAYEDEPGPVWLTCPEFGWEGEYLMDVAADIDERLATESHVYLMIEPEIPYFDPTDLCVRWGWEEVARYSRPHNGMEIIIFRLTPTPPVPEQCRRMLDS